MTSQQKRQATEVLEAVASGREHAADRLMPIVYDEFRKLAATSLQRESPGHTLQPTALVNEVYLKLVDQTKTDWQGRTHFFAVGAQAMRRILVDHARSKKRAKRGGGRQRISLDEELTLSPQRDEDLLALDEALETLAKRDERQAKIVELRFFGGLSIKEVAHLLGVSERTIGKEWTMIRAWLRRELAKDDDS
jgi:RNA polymerase sigma factor (TIGR02999 family)